MRRMVLAFSAIAALAAFSSNAQAGHTAAEVHMFFGNGSVGAPGTPSFTDGVNPSVDAMPGDTVWFPVYLRAMAGDQSVATIGYAIDVLAAGSAAVSGAAGQDLNTFSGVSNNGSAGDGTVTVGRSRVLTNMFNRVLDLANGAAPGVTRHVGWVSMVVNGNVGDMVDLYMAVGQDQFGLNGATGPLTVGFGWDAALPGGIDTYRAQNPATDVIGTTPGHTSVMSDAKINLIVPEPATFGLLGLGLLAIRRRRNA